MIEELLKEWKMNEVAETWYEEVAADEKLTQGDIIDDCPIVTWRAESPSLEIIDHSERLKTMVEAIVANVVVMSQTCDLKEDKVNKVVLCPYVALSEHKSYWEAFMRERGQNPTSKTWKAHCDDICDGFIWNLTILNEKRNSGISTEHLIVDFHDIFTIPRVFLESYLHQRGHPRLRLLPPYREHLSQSFARYFMRVGLPISVATAW